MAETINCAGMDNAVVLVGHRSTNGAVHYQRGVKPQHEGYLVSNECIMPPSTGQSENLTVSITRSPNPNGLPINQLC
ncbi:MAG: hypothetical protein GX456_02140 [Verrucomicrobia bacterium]|nr:hypothetical protein [Verrucomicrobiota bacterium]